VIKKIVDQETFPITSFRKKRPTEKAGAKQVILMLARFFFLQTRHPRRGPPICHDRDDLVRNARIHPPCIRRISNGK